MSLKQKGYLLTYAACLTGMGLGIALAYSQASGLFQQIIGNTQKDGFGYLFVGTAALWLSSFVALGAYIITIIIASPIITFLFLILFHLRALRTALWVLLFVILESVMIVVLGFVSGAPKLTIYVTFVWILFLPYLSRRLAMSQVTK